MGGSNTFPWVLYPARGLFLVCSQSRGWYYSLGDLSQPWEGELFLRYYRSAMGWGDSSLGDYLSHCGRTFPRALSLSHVDEGAFLERSLSVH